MTCEVNSANERQRDDQGTLWLLNRLKERIGCLKVIYRRDPEKFLNNLSQKEQKEELESLQNLYKKLLLSFFQDPNRINADLEVFVNSAFFLDLQIPKIIEIHTLILEHESIAQFINKVEDFSIESSRLVLIEVVAHLCEMYRKSIPSHSFSQITDEDLKL